MINCDSLSNFFNLDEGISIFENFDDLAADTFLDDAELSQELNHDIDAAIEATLTATGEDDEFDTDPLHIETDLIEEAAHDFYRASQSAKWPVIPVPTLEEMMAKLDASMKRTARTRDIVFNTIVPTFKKSLNDNQQSLLRSKAVSAKKGKASIKTTKRQMIKRRLSNIIVKRRLSSLAENKGATEAFFQSTNRNVKIQSISDFLRCTKKW